MPQSRKPPKAYLLLVYVVLPTVALLVMLVRGFDRIESEIVFTVGLILFNKVVGVAVGLACSGLFYKSFD